MFIAKTFFKLFLVHWKRYIVLICLTVLLSFSAGQLGNFLLYQEAVDPFVVIIVDEDDNLVSRTFYSALNQIDDHERLFSFIKMKQPAAMARLREDEDVVAVIVIPQGFVDDLLYGRNTPFSVTYNSAAPLRAGLVRQFVEALTEMFAAAQKTVYASLDYVREYGSDEAYDAAFQQVNMRLLSLAMERQRLVESQTVSVLGPVNIFTHYGISAGVFVMLLGGLLLIDVLQKNGSQDLFLRLRQMGVGAWKVTGGILFALFLYYLAIALPVGLCLSLGTGLLGVYTLAGIALTALAGAVIALAVAVWLSRSLWSNVFLLLYSLLCLFLSGGILPSPYLPDGAQAAGRWTAHYWLVELFEGQGSWRSIAAVIALCAAWVLFAWLRVQRKGRARRK